MSARETPPTSRHLSPLQGRTRSREEEDHGEPSERVKKAKLRNLNPVLQQEEEASECGSTTSSVENNEAMRRWKEMKQNCFAYNWKAPIPNPWKCQQTKKKDEELKKNTDMTKEEQAKISASGQLLCGLNPGIIKHVRNSKQVNSIIKAMLQNENLEKQELRRRSKEEINLWKQQRNSLAVDNHENYNSECEDDAVTLKLASAVTKTSSANAGFSKNWEDITYLSFKAAKVASQWLEFLRHDIELRLATLGRSKKRVKNVIQVELPYLISRDCPPKKENDAPFPHSFLIGCSNKAASDMHLVKWKALFNQMELSLTVQGKQLEKWLGQVEELLSQCEKGVEYVSANLRVLKNREGWEREFAVRAAAASIYSTCNMIMTAENVPCF